MSRNRLKIPTIVSIGMALCLLLGNAARSGAAGNTPTPTPSSAPVVLIFTQSSQYSLPRDELTFTIRGDATTTLTTSIVGRSDTVELWQQPGTISAEELARVKVLALALDGIMDQSVPDLKAEFTFEFPQPAGSMNPVTKTIHLSPRFEHIEPENQPVLKLMIQTLSDLRKASEPLVIFGWSGGFASSPSQLSLLNDGTAAYLKWNQPRAAFVISDTDRLLIIQLIQDPAVQNNQPNGNTGCADCYIFTLSFMTADGNVKTVTVDEAELETAPEPIQRLVSTLKRISEGGNNGITVTPSAQTTQTPLPTEIPSSTPTPTLIRPASDCCTEMITQGDFTRRISILSSGDVLIGAARRLQLHPNEPPTQCVVLIMTGPLSYDVTIFDGDWIQVEKDATTKHQGAVLTNRITGQRIAYSDDRAIDSYLIDPSARTSGPRQSSHHAPSGKVMTPSCRKS